MHLGCLVVATPATNTDNGAILVLAIYSPKTDTCWVGVDNVSTDTSTVPTGTNWGSFKTSVSSSCDSADASGGGGGGLLGVS